MARFIVDAGLSNDMHWARREPSEVVLNQASNLLRESTHACSGSFGTENLPPRVKYAAFRGRTGIVNRLAWCEPAMDMNYLARLVNQATPTVKHGMKRKPILESLT